MSESQQRSVDMPVPEWRNLATKTDVEGLQTGVAELHTSVVELRTRLEYMATKEDLAELRGEFVGLRGSLRTAGWFTGLVVGLLAVVAQIALFFLQRSLG